MEWSHEDFESMSWHDNHVHAIRVGVDNPEHGTGILELDLDYILEWISAEAGGPFEFRVVPARLSFREVFGLRIEVDWASVSAGMAPFSIGGIERQKLEYPTGRRSWSWTVQVNWPAGSITFDSPGFTQSSYGEEITTPDPCLEAGQRRAG